MQFLHPRNLLLLTATVSLRASLTKLSMSQSSLESPGCAIKQGQFDWLGGDVTMEVDNEIVDNEIGTQKQWKQKMLWPGTWGDAVFLQLACLYLETDLIVIPAFRESAENTTLGYTVFRAEKRTSSEPLYLFYFSDSESKNANYQSVRPATEDNRKKIWDQARFTGKNILNLSLIILS